MNKWNLLIVIATFNLLSCNMQTEKVYIPVTYPVTQKTDTIDTYFGVQVADPYRWLEDDLSEQTKDWVKQQNEATFGYLKQIPYRDLVAERITKMWNFERFSAPYRKAGKYFYSYNDGLKNQSVLYVTDNLDQQGKVLLDPNALAADGTSALTGYSVSEDGKYLAYSISKGGSDWNEIFVKNIASGKDTTDNLKWVKFSGMSWYNDGFYYSRYEEPKASALSEKNSAQKIYYHKIGTSQDKDVLVFQPDGDVQRFYSAGVTQDKAYLIVSESESTSGNNFRIKDLNDPKSEFIQVAKGFDSDYQVIDHLNGKLIVLTNHKAPMYKLVAIDPKNPGEANWTDFVAQKEYVLTDVSVSQKLIFLSYLKDAKSYVEILDLDGKFLKSLELPGIGTVGGISVNKDENFGFYSFSSFTVPSVIFKYDFEKGTSEVYKQPKIDFNFTEYETTQVFYPSKDGTQIPMFLVYKKGLKLNGKNPVWLYGYGGFNISLTPSFSVSRLVWLENGGIFAMPNIRGGGEYGEKWHEAGTILQKQNVFDDFIGAAEYLIMQEYTSAGNIAVHGGSNGGLLVGAVTNQRPELFGVAIPAVGVLDMLRYHKFTIGWAWATDYGTSQNEEQFNYLFKYSPLHNIDGYKKYPAILVTTGDHDDRVVPAHSFKYIATLQEKYKGLNPMLIRIETMGGHGAGKPTAKVIEEAADMYSFAFYNLGIQPIYKAENK